jgi:hypothetical protein
VLLEAHHFCRRTNGKFNSSHPNISSFGWNRSLYRGGDREYDRVEAAYALSDWAALESCSWGQFQIMGFNYPICGFPSAKALVESFAASATNQLGALVEFLTNAGLDSALRARNWARFAEGYNGAGYRLNHYDSKLARIYRDLVRGRESANSIGIGAIGPHVGTIQGLLNDRGANLIVDGTFGPATERAVENFQEMMSLEITGRVGSKTDAALKAKPQPLPRPKPAA